MNTFIKNFALLTVIALSALPVFSASLEEENEIRSEALTQAFYIALDACYGNNPLASSCCKTEQDSINFNAAYRACQSDATSKKAIDKYIKERKEAEVKSDLLANGVYSAVADLDRAIWDDIKYTDSSAYHKGIRAAQIASLIAYRSCLADSSCSKKVNKVLDNDSTMFHFNVRYGRCL